ncbi:N-terminal nucleophile aminohydrolases-2 [Coleophoma cylindrospora]|uniref:N-terminal nucleophile aminohydrolases-2 n=1 Tax=Coleophoma cylindrospora TaxID=1849047 RepID=A0A3D8RMH1_9HELO|nr:N-terminal nucleophile aminohydrolases-2 [Coleophoma cylindrospora]
MEYKSELSTKITPRLIIHGGAGNILPSNLPPAKYKAYHDALLTILSNTHYYLEQGNDALDTVTYAVTQLENNALFNSGHGAVFTREGINELEASVMVSRGKKKRGVGLMGLQHVKNPIKLAREMLIRGEDDIEGGNGEHRGALVSNNIMRKSSGAQGHSQIHKFSAEKLAEEWGLEMVTPDYFFVQTRWDEHISGLAREKSGSGHATWDAMEFVPQGTCGAVCLDADGVCATATSTGGMTNKLTGRIGDTPTLGAGFWAEEWEEDAMSREELLLRRPGPGLILSETLKGLMADCLPSLSMYSPIPANVEHLSIQKGDKLIRSAAMSGTGNGDSFLRINAVRTASAIARYRGVTVQQGLSDVTGPGGELVKSAGPRWKKTGEGEGGIIGVECGVVVGEDGQKKTATSSVVYDYNCGGMFRAAVDDHGKAVFRVWSPEQHEGLEKYEGEGKQYELRQWRDEKPPL